MAIVLIIDDNDTIREGLAHTVRKMGHEVVTAANGHAGIAAFKAKKADFVITDLKMEGGTGVEVLRTISASDPDVPIMIVTGFGTVETAVEAMKLGAFDFLTKPIQTEVVRLKVERALELCAARRSRKKADAMTDYLRAEAEGRFPELVGQGEKMAIVRRTVDKVAASDTTVFVAGESGTGKELVAAAIHEESHRKGRPFVTVNCAAIPRDLVESEMFGHERGSFTGATERRIGRFELAHGGTLFLDEVGDLSQEAQAKLLRTLETGELQRIGAETVTHIDARVVAATNRRLDDAVSNGGFREDLFFRLNVFPIHLPPLRERLEDLPALVAHLAQRVRPRHAATFTAVALETLASYSWPGNIRELANLVERLSILSGPVVDAPAVRQVLRGPSSSPPSAGSPPVQLGRPLNEALDEFERSFIGAALAQAEGNMAEAARILQTDRANLYRRMRRLGLEKSADVES